MKNVSKWTTEWSMNNSISTPGETRAQVNKRMRIADKLIRNVKPLEVIKKDKEDIVSKTK